MSRKSERVEGKSRAVAGNRLRFIVICMQSFIHTFDGSFVALKANGNPAAIYSALICEQLMFPERLLGNISNNSVCI